MKLKHYLSKYGVRIAAVVVILALIAVAVTSVRGGRAGLVQDSGASLRAPVQKAVASVLDWVEGIYGYIYEYDRIVEENNALKAENASLREEARNYEELEAENARFRELLDFQEKHSDFDLEPASPRAKRSTTSPIAPASCWAASATFPALPAGRNKSPAAPHRKFTVYLLAISKKCGIVVGISLF